MESVEKFISVIGALEDAIFQKRMRMLQRDKNRRARDRLSSDAQMGCPWSLHALVLIF